MDSSVLSDTLTPFPLRLTHCTHAFHTRDQSLVILIQQGSWVQVLVLPIFSSHWWIVVQSPSHVWLFVTPWTTAHQASLSPTILWSLPKITFIELVTPAHHLILCPPLLLTSSMFSSISVFSNKSLVCKGWPKYWSFSIRASSKYSGLISFKIDLFDLLVVQGNHKSLLQNNIKSTENINAAKKKKWFLSFRDCKIDKYIGCQMKDKKPELQCQKWELWHHWVLQTFKG